MSKPQPLEWTMLCWKVEYGPRRFVTERETVDWSAQVTWTIEGQTQIKNKVDTGHFKTFEKAREWIELETGLNYPGFSDRATSPNQSNQGEAK